MKGLAMETALSQLQTYQNSVEKLRQSAYMAYPAHVHMETLSLCTAACNFCPYPSLDRLGTRMSDALIRKIIMELKDIPSQLPFQLSPFKVNEPFLDTRLFDILKTVNLELPNAKLTLTSNASPITAKALANLAQINNVRYLWISFNDHREAEYEKTMQLPYERTIERLDMIHQAVAKGSFAPQVILSRVGDGSPADVEFLQWVNSHYPLFQTSIFQRGGWIGQVKDLQLNQPVPNVGCTRWFDLSITSTGKVAHCCMDGKAEWVIGDVNEQHVLEVYNTPLYREVREYAVTRFDAEPCNQCTFL
jgi:radical SAM protein with 4Fe4S-binding SPASM domain